MSTMSPLSMVGFAPNYQLAVWNSCGSALKLWKGRFDPATEFAANAVELAWF